MQMIPLPAALMICANLLPIGTYFCVLGLLHALRRPLVTTGFRDYLALALALSGLTINGPINWVMHSRILPEVLGDSRWLGIVLYVVLVTALLPRGQETLVIYNCSESAVAVAVRGILERLAIPFQEVPGGWIMAQRGMSLELDSFPALQNVTLQFRGLRDRELFRRLQTDLAEELAPSRSPLSLVGTLMAAVGGVVLAMPVWLIARYPQDIAALVREVLGAW
jgi:hypothetical protein